MIKKQVTSNQNNDIIKIKKILNKFFDKDDISLEDDGNIYCPIGCFNKENKIWLFNLDFSFLSGTSDVIMLFYVIKFLIEGNISLKFSCGYHTIFDLETDICCGVIFEDDISKYTKKFGTSYFGSYEILAGKLIDEYRKECIEKEKK
jgi:hypothetical protein